MSDDSGFINWWVRSQKRLERQARRKAGALGRTEEDADDALAQAAVELLKQWRDGGVDPTRVDGLARKIIDRRLFDKLKKRRPDLSGNSDEWQAGTEPEQTRDATLDLEWLRKRLIDIHGGDEQAAEDAFQLLRKHLGEERTYEEIAEEDAEEGRAPRTPGSLRGKVYRLLKRLKAGGDGGWGGVEMRESRLSVDDILCFALGEARGRQARDVQAELSDSAALEADVQDWRQFTQALRATLASAPEVDPNERPMQARPETLTTCLIWIVDIERLEEIRRALSRRLRPWGVPVEPVGNWRGLVWPGDSVLVAVEGPLGLTVGLAMRVGRDANDVSGHIRSREVLIDAHVECSVDLVATYRPSRPPRLHRLAVEDLWLVSSTIRRLDAEADDRGPL